MPEHEERRHWGGTAKRYDLTTGLITGPSRDARTRCGIRIFQTRRLSAYGDSTAPRKMYYGDTIDIPNFLRLPERCRRCGALLRQDTRLLSGGSD